MNFPQRVKELRNLRGLTQQQMADKLNVSKSIVSCWESGRRVPTMAGMTEIAEIMGVSVNFLIGDTDDVLTYDKNMNDVAQAIIDRPELRMLFNASLNAKRDDILMCVTLLERLTND